MNTARSACSFTKLMTDFVDSLYFFFRHSPSVLIHWLLLLVQYFVIKVWSPGPNVA
jgi:hypothetical protein